MLDGVNDSDAEARALVKLLRDVPSKVNLIPFNPFPNTAYTCSPQKRIDAFRDILIQHGMTTITRKTRGNDIEAACGQLAGQVMDRTKRSIRRLQQAGVGQSSPSFYCWVPVRPQTIFHRWIQNVLHN